LGVAKRTRKMLCINSFNTNKAYCQINLLLFFLLFFCHHSQSNHKFQICHYDKKKIKKKRKKRKKKKERKEGEKNQ